MDGFFNGIKGYAQNAANMLGSPRIGVVTSYNPNDSTAKITIQPEGVTTGWLPVSSTSVGAGWGLHVPLKTGEQVIAVPVDGDANSLVIVGRLFSDAMQPPGASGSDIILKSSGGAIINLKSDGTATHSDASGTTLHLTNDGNATLTCSSTFTINAEQFTVNASAGVTIQTPFTNISNELDVAIGPIKQNGVTVIVP